MSNPEEGAELITGAARRMSNPEEEAELIIKVIGTVAL